MVDVNFHIQKLGTLRSDRSNFDSQWEEAAARLIPAHTTSFLGQGFATAMTQGRKGTELMYDSTAALALHRFQSVMDSLATPQGQQWHRLVPADPELKKNRQVKLFLDQVNSLLFQHRYRPKANFVGQIQKVYAGYGAYGNGLLFADELGSEPGLRYRSLHLGETYFCENHQGVVDTMYRCFNLEPAQLISQFGEAVPKDIQDEVKDANKSKTKHEVLHCVYPRDQYDPRRRDGKGMPWASIYILIKTQKVLREGGYNSFPTAVARYSQYANETYGRGPAQLVLPAIKVLNEEKKTILKQGHRVVDPVLLAHDDGAVGTFSLRAGAINVGGVNAQGRALVHALPTGNVMVGKELMDDERQVINDAFLITLFQILVDNPQMTATEVLERAREKGMLIAPTAGRLQAEFLGPLIEREVDLLEQQRLLPPVPDILKEAGGGFSVEYDSPMARMARAENASGFIRSLDMAVAFFESTQNPGPLDWFNFDVAMPAIQDINGAPTAWTHTVEEVEAIRKARAEAAETQQMIEAAPAMASVMKTAGTMEGGGSP
jgi:hypothetical protein